MEQKAREKLLEKMGKGDAKACARLIEEGAIDPNERHSGHTYLHWAAAEGHAEVCRVLLAAKAKPNLKGGKQRVAPLHTAAIYGHAEACEVLLKGRADPNSRDKSSYTPLHFAALNNNAEICRVLLEGGADINAEPIGDWTRAGDNPLFACVSSQSSRKRDPKEVFDTLSVLLEHGAAADAADFLRYTPLHKMAAAGNFDACRLLIANGAHVKAINHFGATPLHMAATAGQADICAYLIKEGAGVRAKDSDGMTAMAIAKQKGFRDVELALKSKSTRDKLEKEIAQGKPAGKGKTEKKGPGGGL